jgi:predicted restriction endonuclease
MIELIDGGDDIKLADALASTPAGISVPPNTSSLSVVAVRLRQARFRRRLDQYWNGRCAVTGLEVRDLLRASHIKRWSDSDDYERLDPFNGLLLSAAYDAAFDKGLVTFNNAGQIMLSTALSAEAARQAGIDPLARIKHLQPAHHPYLAHHRATYFGP